MNRLNKITNKLTNYQGTQVNFTGKFYNKNINTQQTIK